MMKTDCWVIVTPEGKIIQYTVRRTRQECISNALGMWCIAEYGWPRCYRRGYRCVKAKLEVSDEVPMQNNADNLQNNAEKGRQ